MQNSSIEWTDHTFNIVWGCQRVSPGCEHCYAETMAKRYGYDIWGPAKTTGRRTMGDAYWVEPLKWDSRAAKEGQRQRVFCSSMADVFENHPTNNEERPRLWQLIMRTPWLDWLLLTKRPENVMGMTPDGLIPKNVWIGTSVENQEWADKRRPYMEQIPAAVRFVSYEPALGNVKWHGWEFLNWLIIGGESGNQARPFNTRWASDAVRFCHDYGIAPFIKQLGSKPYMDRRTFGAENWMSLADKKGGNIDEWPLELQVRQFPRKIAAGQLELSL